MRPDRTSYHPRLQGQGIFVVGHARSGTTVLSDALNTSPDVYCLGEANLHLHSEKPDFAGWYNTMHRQFNNPYGRTAWVPEIPGSGWDVLAELHKNFRYVGEKVAFRQEGRGYDFQSFFRFQTRHFPRAHYVCVIRDPLRVTASAVHMFESADFSAEPISALALSQLQAYYLILCLYRTLPNVFVLVHERIDDRTFATLGEAMTTDFSRSARCYNFGRTLTKAHLWERVGDHPLLKTLQGYHRRLSAIFDPATLRATYEDEVEEASHDLYKGLRQHPVVFPPSPEAPPSETPRTETRVAPQHKLRSLLKKSFDFAMMHLL